MVDLLENGEPVIVIRPSGLFGPHNVCIYKGSCDDIFSQSNWHPSNIITIIICLDVGIKLRSKLFAV